MTDAAGISSSWSILDVGCGFGRYLRLLNRPGMHAVGVDVSSEVVAHNQTMGFECYLPDATEWRMEYDCILMSHIIEHFSPSELVSFMEGYLQYLRPGGYLVIATPLLTNYFFDDFTHIKPYHPESILMIFGDANPQVSMRSSTKLVLRDLWFRRSAYRIRRVRMNYVGTAGKVVIKAINGMLAILYVASSGLLGKKDGWAGAFQKVE